MKRMLRPSLMIGAAMIVFLALASGFGAQQPRIAEPFGFRAGMTRAEVIAAVGTQAVIKNVGDMLVLSTAPEPNPEFDMYMVLVPSTTGLAEVKAFSNTTETDSFGDQLKDKFAELQTALEKQYSDPTIGFDVVQAGSMLKETGDWMTELFNKERTLATFWTTNPQMTIALDALALAPDKGYVVVTYQFANFAFAEREHNANKD
jgi:hypothetical protein